MALETRLLAKGAEGVRFGAYKAERLLGRGGMASVYEATHETSGQLVALKVLNASLAHDSVSSRRFLREADLIDRVRHPHVVRVFDVGLEGDVPFMVMELLHGETLAHNVRRLGPMPVGTLVEVFSAVCSAVAAIHDAGIVHRDLKTSNVMLVRRYGSPTHPMVLDFGISKIGKPAFDESLLTESRGMIGTVRYLSPEQTLNTRAAGPFSDQYALGVMLYEAATGTSPFVGGSTYELMHAIVNGAFLPPSAHLPELPPALERVILTAMDRDIARRFHSVSALAGALTRCAGTEHVGSASQDFGGPQRVTDATEHDGSIRAIALDPPAPETRAARHATPAPFVPAPYPAALALALGTLLSGDFGHDDPRERTPAASSRLETADDDARSDASEESPTGLRPATAAVGRGETSPSTSNAPATSATRPSSPARRPAIRRPAPAALRGAPTQGAAPGKDEAIDPFAPIE